MHQVATFSEQAAILFLFFIVHLQRFDSHRKEAHSLLTDQSAEIG